MRYLLSLLLSLSLSGVCEAGSSRDFDGTNDSVNWGDATIQDGLTAFSVASWVNINAFPGGANTDSVIRKDGSLTALQVNGTAGIAFAIWDTALRYNNENNTGYNTLVNTWAAYCVRWSTALDSGFPQLWVNGTNSGRFNTTANAATGAIANSAVNLMMGETESGGEDFDGQIAYVQYFNRDIGTDGCSEATKHPGSVPGLIFFAPLLGTSPETDWAGTGLTGTVTNSVASASGPPVFLTSPLASWHRFWKQVADWFVPQVFADDIVTCDPSDLTVPNRVIGYERSTDPVKSGAATNPNALIWSLPPSSVRPWDGVPPPGGSSYWKCIDTNADTILDDVVEMSQAEQDAINAPAVAEAARQQTFSDEIATNDICDAELSDIAARIQTIHDARIATITASRDAFNTSVDAAGSNIAAMKALLKDLSNRTAQGMGLVEDDLQLVVTRAAKCTRARAR